MTINEFSQMTAGRAPHRAHGWIVSMVCHVLALACAVMLMPEIEKPVHPESFQWDVAIVEAPTPAEASPVDPPPAPPKRPPVKSPAERQPVTKPVRQTVREVAPPIEAQEPVQQVVQETTPMVEAVHSVQQVTPEVMSSVRAAVERPPVERTETPTVMARAVTTSPVPVVEQTPSQTAISSAVERVESIEARPLAQTAPQVVSSEPIERL